MPRVVTRSIVLAVIASLLQLGVATIPVLASTLDPAGLMSTAHDPGHALDGCPQGDCAPGQCDMAVGIDCCCLCAHAPLQSAGPPGPLATAPAMVIVRVHGGLDLRRPDRPFRPPALA